MDIQRIEIDITDPKYLSRLAYLVDRDDFLDDVADIRKKIGLNVLLREDQINTWQEKEVKNGYLEKDKYTNEKGVTSYYTSWLRSEKLVIDLLRKYKRHWEYFMPVYYAVLTGRITLQTLSNAASCGLIYPEQYYRQVMLGDKEPQLAIFLTPETTRKEVIAAYDHHFRQTVDEYKSRTSYSSPKYLDTITNIKRDRDWYWKHKIGTTSYQKLALEKLGLKQKSDAISTFRNPVAELADTIRKAIKQYERKLNTPIAVPET